MHTPSIHPAGFYDYSPERYVFSFGPSSEQRQCRHIEILADELLEKQEVFKASLQLLQDNLLNLPQMDVLVTIEDNLNTSGIGKRDLNCNINWT